MQGRAKKTTPLTANFGRLIHIVGNAAPRRLIMFLLACFALRRFFFCFALPHMCCSRRQKVKCWKCMSNLPPKLPLQHAAPQQTNKQTNKPLFLYYMSVAETWDANVMPSANYGKLGFSLPWSSCQTACPQRNATPRLASPRLGPSQKQQFGYMTRRPPTMLLPWGVLAWPVPCVCVCVFARACACVC